ncbi:universal stress protein [Ponticoccus sp. (in: a-proteobacteria)]|uniref:universal stress protein n=1 Tax=Ponticoccus sp. (in: a-proteobacteria) TaxID=1925025 RepID=UPI003AB7B941
MTYKTVLTALTDTSLLNSTLAQSAAFAQGHDAHLEVICLGVDRTQTGYYYAGANAMVLQETLSRANAEAEELAGLAKERLQREELRWAVDHRVAQLADIGRQIAAHARFADLVVLPQPYGKERGIELEPVTEGALFEGQVPVMIVPDGVTVKPQPERVVIAWNESREAMRAVRAALPLLTQAKAVHVVVIDPPQHGPTRSDPGGLLSQFLARHGVRPKVDVLSKTMPSVADVLLRHVTDVDADLVVMGAYGHSRFREAILGGATRSMLEQTQVSVLMAH